MSIIGHNLLHDTFQHMCHICNKIFELPDTTALQSDNTFTSSSKGEFEFSICESIYGNGCVAISKWEGNKKTSYHLCSKKCYDSYKRRKKCTIL